MRLGIPLLIALLAPGRCDKPPEPLAPTVVLVSLDGFRADYLERFAPPTLQRLAAQGVRADFLRVSFPSKTFPSHYTLVTGLYPAHHGIVSNAMYDPATSESFGLSDRDAVTDARWWGGEPIWVTLRNAKKVAAPFFWPGSEAPIGGRLPRYSKPFASDVPAGERIDWIVEALAAPAAERPVFLTLYLSDVDGAGHRHGPDSEELARAVGRVDSLVQVLDERLRDFGYADAVNLIITSDHGMASTSRERVVLLDDHIDLDDVHIPDLDPVAMLRPKPGQLEQVYTQLRSVPHVRFYRKDSLPQELHYASHRRIPDLIGIAEEGWRISTRSSFQRNPGRYDGGTHGYDPALPSMHAIFIAHGPAFARQLEVPGFSNVHVYALLAHVLGVEPAPNDGALDSVRHVLRP